MSKTRVRSMEEFYVRGFQEVEGVHKCRYHYESLVSIKKFVTWRRVPPDFARGPDRRKRRCSSLRLARLSGRRKAVFAEPFQKGFNIVA